MTGFSDLNMKIQAPLVISIILSSLYFSRQSEKPKKKFVGIFEYILASMLKVFLNM